MVAVMPWIMTASVVGSLRIALTNVPADAGQVDDVDLAAPEELRRPFEPHAGERRLQVLRLQLRPVGVEVVHLENDHLVLLPLGHVDVREQEARPAEAQPREPSSLPLLLEPDGREKV